MEVSRGQAGGGGIRRGSRGRRGRGEDKEYRESIATEAGRWKGI
jgi:hypothetical protein